MDAAAPDGATDAATDAAMDAATDGAVDGSADAAADGGGIASRQHNLVFVSSQTYAMDLGLAAYDQACNALATAAGLNVPTEDAFVAWMATSTDNAADRLGSARGFIRMDGKPVADNLASAEHFNYVLYDEMGDPVDDTYATGADEDGSAHAAQTCGDWSDASGTVWLGRTGGGPYSWTGGIAASCLFDRHLLCVETRFNSPVAPQPTSGKLVFVTDNGYTPGATVGTPDDLCDYYKPAGTGTVKAFLSTTTAAASDLLDPSAVYVRPDGVVVGTGAQLATGGDLNSGIWQTGDGTYLSVYGALVWTGSPSPDQVGTAASTCDDWSANTGTGGAGLFPTGRQGTWWDFGTQTCTHAWRFYCVEQ